MGAALFKRPHETSQQKPTPRGAQKRASSRPCTHVFLKSFVSTRRAHTKLQSAQKSSRAQASVQPSPAPTLARTSSCSSINRPNHAGVRIRFCSGGQLKRGCFTPKRQINIKINQLLRASETQPCQRTVVTVGRSCQRAPTGM